MAVIFSLRAFWEPSQGKWASEALSLTQTRRCTGSTTMLRGVTCKHRNMSILVSAHYAHCADSMPTSRSIPDRVPPILPSIEFR